MGTDWFDNDELFAQQLAVGHKFAENVVELLVGRGLYAEATPMEWRTSIEQRGAFASEIDITVGRSRTVALDVKARKLRFTGPTDYPYATAFVDTVSGWDQKRVRPAAIVLISQPTGGIAVIGRSTELQWTIETRFDRERRIQDRFYMINRTLLRTMDELVAYLQTATD